MNDKRNPSIVRGDGETIISYRERLHELLARIEWQSEGHRQWYTHKNPYGCWICELLQIARQTTDELVDDGDNQPDNLNYDEEMPTDIDEHISD